MNIRDRQFLITGAAGGLGGALAQQLARQGAHLLLLDKDSKGLDWLSDRICDEGLPEPGVCPLDLAGAGPAEFQALVEVLDREFGGLAHLVHCAADFDGLAPLNQISPEDWLKCLQVNLNSAWLLTVNCLPLLRQAGNSSITFILDDAGKMSGPYWGAYGVSKAAVQNLAGMFGQELEGSGVRVFAINPGPMSTGLRARAYFTEDPASLNGPEGAVKKIISLIEEN